MNDHKCTELMLTFWILKFGFGLLKWLQELSWMMRLCISCASRQLLRLSSISYDNVSSQQTSFHHCYYSCLYTYFHFDLCWAAPFFVFFENNFYSAGWVIDLKSWDIFLTFASSVTLPRKLFHMSFAGFRGWWIYIQLKNNYYWWPPSLSFYCFYSFLYLLLFLFKTERDCSHYDY